MSILTELRIIIELMVASFSVECNLCKIMRRLFKYGDIHTPTKEPNILIYWPPSYVIIYRNYALLKCTFFYWATLSTVCTCPLTTSEDGLRSHSTVRMRTRRTHAACRRLQQLRAHGVIITLLVRASFSKIQFALLSC